jgi:hypothetical protein
VQSSYGTQSSGSEGFKQFLNRYHYDGSYTPKSKQWKEETLDRAAALVALAQEWQSDPTIRSGSIPKPDSVMRLTPQE